MHNCYGKLFRIIMRIKQNNVFLTNSKHIKEPIFTLMY